MATERAFLRTVNSLGLGDIARGFLGLFIAIVVAWLTALVIHRLR